jgi:CHAD domain-containing protein
MKDNSIDQWLTHHYHSISSDATGIASDFFPEQIHRFRVEAKRIRAVIGFLNNNKDYRPPRQFRKLYTTAGAIRDYQVPLQTAATEKGGALPSFCIWLGYRMADASRSWKSKKVAPALKALEDSLDQDNCATVNEERYWNWYKDFLQWLQRYLTDSPSDEMLHEVRKHAKNMQYITAFCAKLFSESTQEYQVMEQQLHQLATCAGTYNDETNLLIVTKKYAKQWGKLLGEVEIKSLAAAQKEWSAQKIRIGKELVQAIRGLLRSIDHK